MTRFSRMLSSFTLKTATALVTITVAASALADDVIDYTVKKGDTCAAIAQRQWGDARRVDLIHQNNPNMGPPPHDLKEGTVLHIPRTIPAPLANAPDARLTHFRNKVTTLTPEPAPAKVDAALNRGNRVSTEDQSAAQVTFRDESQIELGEKTLVVILGDMRASAARTQNAGDTTLVTGSLRSKLGQIASKPPVVATEGARVALGRGATQISVDEQKTTRLAVYDGQSTLSAQKKDVVVPTNFGSKAELGKAPTPPKPLPGAPTWKVPLPDVALTTADTAEVRATYQRGTGGDAPARYHVQIAHDSAFLEIITDVEVPETISELDAKNLAPGDYHVRVSAIDGDRFEGPWAAPVSLRVATLGRRAGAAAPTGLAGLFCALDGDAFAAANDLKIDPWRAHDLRCSRSADGANAGSIHLAASAFDLRWELVNASATTHSATLRAHANAATGEPVEHLTLSVKPAAGAEVEVFSSPAPGIYEAQITWPRGTGRFVGNVAANGEAHGEVALALPADGDADLGPITMPEPKLVFGELGIGAGFSGSAGGMGPLVALRGGVRRDIDKLELSVNALFSMEARSSDEAGSLPGSLTGGVDVTSYATSERLYTVGLALEGRYKLGKSPFSAGVGLTPFLAIENANVSYFGGNVALPSPNTVFGANVLGVLHLVAGPGSITLEAGARFSTTKDRVVVPVDLLGPYVAIGYRLAL